MGTHFRGRTPLWPWILLCDPRSSPLFVAPLASQDLSQWLDEVGPLPLGIRGIVDYETLHMWVPVPVEPLQRRNTYCVKQFKCDGPQSALSQVAQAAADGNVFLDFGEDLVATYIEITPVEDAAETVPDTADTLASPEHALWTQVRDAPSVGVG